MFGFFMHEYGYPSAFLCVNENLIENCLYRWSSIFSWKYCLKLMIMYQLDSDFVHWVLGGDPFYHSAYNSDMIQHDAGDINHHAHYFRGHTETLSSQIENDEVIAHSLQEEFSHLAVAEASEFSHAGEQKLQASSEPHDWHSPSTRDYYYSGGQKVFLAYSFHFHGIYLLIII